MSIEQTYKEYLARQHLLQRLRQGSFDADVLYDELVELFNAEDYSQPLFSSEENAIVKRSESSVEQLRSTMSQAQQDLIVMFKEMLNLAQASTEDAERWKAESESLESRLNLLQSRIENLLLLSQETEGGYTSILSDNFSDLFFVDLDYSNTLVDIRNGTCAIPLDSEYIQRHFLNDIDATESIRFRVYDNRNFVGRGDGVGTNLADPFRQDTRAWWTTIYTNAPKPVVSELVVYLGEDPVDLSKIVLKVHSANASNPVHITPLLSPDNRTFQQLPTASPTISTMEKAVFVFPSTSARWLKLLLVKDGPDVAGPNTNFSYYFGFKTIELYAMDFGDVAEAAQPFSLISEPRYALGPDNLAKEFKKCALEVCENVPSDTSIKYYVTVSTDPDVPIDGNTRWIPVDPLNRTTAENPQVIVFGDSDEILLGDDEDVSISYDIAATPKMPADTFQLVSLDTDNQALVETITADSERYSLLHENIAILNLQQKLDPTTNPSGTGIGFEIPADNISVFRNIGERGLNGSQPEHLVRGVIRGWSFEDPWYKTVIQVNNPYGMAIDIGPASMIIDGQRFSGKITSQVLTGKTNVTTGLHHVSVHKDNWYIVESGAATIISLRQRDPLYPYNIKYLVEGYEYDAIMPEEEKIYLGADLFAEMTMKRISLFDFYENSESRNSVFALDTDGLNTHTDGNLPTRVFLVKFDSNTTDFLNEKFLIKMTRHNTLYRYLRFKADLLTENSSATPVLTGYKIKLG